ncbi:hypothetical protein TNCV_3314201 [Trichonephila clavipes]|nr:hypothetical protein TNCV_3314201 [Trichonephila clavipes]
MHPKPTSSSGRIIKKSLSEIVSESVKLEERFHEQGSISNCRMFSVLQPCNMNKSLRKQDERIDSVQLEVVVVQRIVIQ